MGVLRGEGSVSGGSGDVPNELQPNQGSYASPADARGDARGGVMSFTITVSDIIMAAILVVLIWAKLDGWG
jgi:hypothetical protein